MSEIFTAFIDAKVFDKNNTLKSRQRQTANSFVLNFLKMLYANFGKTAESLVDTTGTARTLGYGTNYAGHFWNIDFAIGASSQAVSVNDYELISKIGNGNTNGLLQYSTLDTSTVSVSSTQSTLAFTRSFTNNGTTTVTIQEIGLYLTHTDSSNTSRTFLVARDIVSPSISVAAGETASLLYSMVANI